MPACRECNMAGCKGEKIALNTNATDPFHDWFHPYLRPLANWRCVGQHPPLATFRVEFNRVDGRTKPYLVSDDPITQTRLKNLDWLVKLEETWTISLVGIIGGTISKIDSEIEELKRRLTRDELLEKLHKWSASAKAEIGYVAQAILEYYYLRTAATGEPVLFDELWIHNSSADPVFAV